MQFLEDEQSTEHRRRHAQPHSEQGSGERHSPVLKVKVLHKCLPASLLLNPAVQSLSHHLVCPGHHVTHSVSQVLLLCTVQGQVRGEDDEGHNLAPMCVALEHLAHDTVVQLLQVAAVQGKCGQHLSELFLSLLAQGVCNSAQHLVDSVLRVLDWRQLLGNVLIALLSQLCDDVLSG